MQRTTLFNLISRVGALACAAVLATAGQAAELGDVAVRSYIGQPLAADIELVSLAPDEVNALQVRLALPDVYRGGNITMNPALASVHMAVVKRDQKQFLHVTTTRPVDANYVHLYLELSAAGRQDVRLATVWLQADPNPPPPPPSPAALAAAEAERVAAQAKAERAKVAAAAAEVVPPVPTVVPAAPARRPAPLPSLHESEVGTPGALKAAAAAAKLAAQAAGSTAGSTEGPTTGLPRRSPAAASMSASVRDLPERIAGAMGTSNKSAASVKIPVVGEAAAKPSASQEVPTAVSQALLPAMTLPKGVKAPVVAPTCAPSGISSKECAALDNHNSAISSKLVELEGKVKVLQGALSATATASARAAAVPAAVAPAATAAAASASHAASAHAASAPAADAHKASSAAASAAASVPGAAKAAAASMAGAAVGSANAAEIAAPAADAKHGASAAASAASAPAEKTKPASASASASEHGSAEASAAASASAASEASAASVPPVPTKMVRVLPKLKYKKEKPVEKPTNYPALIAAGVGVLLLAGAGAIYWRRRKAGAGPLKIWQGFRKKKPAEPVPEEAQPLHEVTPESLTQ